jgi:hypothetical protein
MHEPLSRGQLSFIDRTASSAAAPEAAGPNMRMLDVPAGLFSQPSQATQEQQAASGGGRQPLDLRKTAAITVAIANVQIRDDEMTSTSQEAAAAAVLAAAATALGGAGAGAGASAVVATAAAAAAGTGAGPSSSRPPNVLQRGYSSSSQRPGLTVEVASRVPSQDMW